MEIPCYRGLIRDDLTNRRVTADVTGGKKFPSAISSTRCTIPSPVYKIRSNYSGPQRMEHHHYCASASSMISGLAVPR
jgi:hypothetical protein